MSLFSCVLHICLTIGVSLPLFAPNDSFSPREEGHRFRNHAKIKIGKSVYNLDAQQLKLLEQAETIRNLSNPKQSNLASFGIVLLRPDKEAAALPTTLLRNQAQQAIFFLSGEQFPDEEVKQFAPREERDMFMLAEENNKLKEELRVREKKFKNKEQMEKKLNTVKEKLGAPKEMLSAKEKANLQSQKKKLEQDLEKAKSGLASRPALREEGVLYTRLFVTTEEFIEDLRRRRAGLEGSRLEEPAREYFANDLKRLEKLEGAKKERARASYMQPRNQIVGRHLHSERLVVQYLNDQGVLDKLVNRALEEAGLLTEEKTLKKNHGIEGVAFLLHTDYLVCPTCAYTLFQENEMEKGVFSLLRKTLEMRLGLMNKPLASALLVSARGRSPNETNQYLPGMDGAADKPLNAASSPYYIQTLPKGTLPLLPEPDNTEMEAANDNQTPLKSSGQENVPPQKNLNVATQAPTDARQENGKSFPKVRRAGTLQRPALRSQSA